MHSQDAAKTKVWKSPSSGLTLTVTETLIGQNTSEIVDDSFLQGPDGRSVAYVVMSGGSMTVHCNNEPGAAFDGISLNTLRFSPDGSRMAYIGVREDKQIVVLDGKEYNYPAITESGVQFSPDSKHTAWVVKTDSGQQALVFDGVMQGAHEGVSPNGVLFSPDGEHYAYQATDGGLTCLVVDGIPGPHVQEILTFHYSQVGSRLAYIAVTENKKLLFIDGELAVEVDGVGKGGVRFTADGEHFFLPVRRGDVWSMLIDDRFEGEYAALLPNFKVRKDGNRYAYLASPAEGAGLSLFINGEEIRKSKGIQSLSFNPESDDLAYVNRVDSKSYAIINGESGPGFDSIERRGIIFSRDGQHYAYSARNGNHRFVVLDGEISKPLDRYGPVQPTFLDDGTLVYTAIIDDSSRYVFNNEHQPPFGKVNALFMNADSTHSAYTAREGNRSVAVIDGKRDAEYARIPRAPLFSDDGTQYAYVGLTGTKFDLILNGEVKESYDYVMERSITFTPDSKHLVYLAARGASRFLAMDDIEVMDNYTGFLQLRNLNFVSDNKFYVRASRGDDMLLLTCEFQTE